MESTVKQVTIFSTNWCPYCKFEEEWLQDNGVEYKVVMVDEDMEAAMYITKKTQQNGVPVTEVIFQDDSAEYIIGFDKPRLTKLLIHSEKQTKKHKE